ncbi:hypothetical protein CYLTODRAFT_373583 [Cylindrobasidium torrendii FP15055 ss-10]|uniref:Zn(2)-C6 fungal-type domain-containing protein n=1 Tax=Cylindrobasidium torrendii FP15055 ss-10 TaxID=1314674 RepID=A0A0D7BGZ3_9AGAR|nr:hypothetical protein CYLTODRAFT_373583 [Cylindrobasidium torrendii FP15055 ss-10]
MMAGHASNQDSNWNHHHSQQEPAMIGPATTFYDPGASANYPAVNEQAYTQWAQSYQSNGGQQQQSHYPQQQHRPQQQWHYEAQYANDGHYYEQTQPPQPGYSLQSQSLPQSSTSPSLPPSQTTQTTNTKAPTKPPPNKRKRAAPAPEPGSDSDDDDNAIMIGGINGNNGSGNGKSRPTGACTHCKKLKMKCDFSPPGADTCKRCKGGGHVCIVEGRKQRTAPNKREYLLAQIRQKDAIIDSLLKQLNNPFLSTPLSIASYKSAVNDASVVQWLNTLQSPKPDSRSDMNTPRDSAPVDDESDEDDESLGEDQDGVDDEGSGTALPESHVPIGLIATLSLTNQGKHAASGSKAPDDLDDENVGVANKTYFMPGPATSLDQRASLIDQHSPPEILVHGLVTPTDVDELFKVFYERVNPFISLLDPAIHTPQTTFTRCPFLFTVICAISSRYHPPKASIYPIAMHFAKHSAANALIDGWKSVELCQAYILMSIYAVPARRWEEDRSWLYTGLAIRIATDLSLHQPTRGATNDREQLNRQRVWQICFNLDRSTATQFGRPTTVREDANIRNSVDWYKRSKNNIEYDVHMCAYTVLLRIVARFHEDILQANGRRIDFRALTLPYDKELDDFYHDWDARFKEVDGDEGAQVRRKLMPFLLGYSRLVIWSFGFQQAYSRGIRDGDELFFKKCLDSAKSVIRIMTDDLIPTGFMRYSPDGHFVFCAFASAFLLKLLRPEFMASSKNSSPTSPNGPKGKAPSHPLLTKADEDEIFGLIAVLIQKLSSNSVAIDERHTPRLYARFLAGLLGKCRREASQEGGMSAALGAPSAPIVQQPHYQSPQNGYSHAQSQEYSNYQYQQQQHQQQQYPVQFGNGGDIAFNFEYPGLGLSESALGVAGGQQPAYAQDGHSPGSDPGVLAALKNPAWWDTMMMPGFTWPESAGSPGSSVGHGSSNGMNGETPPMYGQQHHLGYVNGMA